MGLDERLKEWATPTQAKYLDAINLHGSARSAARTLGVNKSAVSRAIQCLKVKAAAHGYAPDQDLIRPTAPGFVTARVATYYKATDETPGQWHIQVPDKSRAEETVREFVEWLVGSERYPSTPGPERCLSDLLAVYIFGDPHFGMRSLAADGGDDFNLDDADRLTRRGIERLADATPDTEEAVLIIIGDNTHANDGSHKTPQHGNPLDMDVGGHSRSMLVSARAWAYACKVLLDKHARVRVWFMPGNHDPDAAFALAMAVALYFDSEPRITIDLSPSLYRYLRFGKVLIGAHHGHGAKMGDLPLLMAVDSPADWGASDVRYIYQGHIHHDSVKEVQGVRVESVRTLAGKDAWHAGKGYRSLRDTRSIVHHKDFGEVERHTCSAAMLTAAEAA